MSSIPAVLDALVRIAGTTAAAISATVPNVQVIDGQPLNLEDNYLAIGFTRNPESYAVEFETDAGNLGQGSTDETYTVEGEASCWNGDGDEAAQKRARDGAFAIFDAFKAQVLADAALSEVVGQAWVGDRGGVIQGVLGAGAVCTVPFGIRVTAYPIP